MRRGRFLFWEVSWLLTKDEAKVTAWRAVADLVGRDYFRNHFEGACQAFPDALSDQVDFEYFIGFEGDVQCNLWTVFARVSVNRETKRVTFLDYRLPNGERMANPISPVKMA